MAEETEKPNINLSHTRVISQGFNRKEIESILTAELVRRAKAWGVEVNLNRGERTQVECEWADDIRVLKMVKITIEEDLAPVTFEGNAPP